jgi:von Willebrand factor type A domain.
VIQSFVTVDTKNGSDGYLNNTENYTISNGDFIESSGDTEPVEFVQDREESTPTDIVFVIDRTNNMGDEIAKIRAELKSMNTTLSSSRGDVRYGLVTFANSEVAVSEPFTRNISTINNTLDELGTEDNIVSKYNYEALDLGLNELDYRPEAQQVVINAIDDGVDTREKTPPQSQIQTQIEDRGINYIAISPGDKERQNSQRR